MRVIRSRERKKEREKEQNSVSKSRGRKKVLRPIRAVAVALMLVVHTHCTYVRTQANIIGGRRRRPGVFAGSSFSNLKGATQSVKLAWYFAYVYEGEERNEGEHRH